jgi:CDP-diacylglycerol---serine O-phosphatidyltransferase
MNSSKKLAFFLPNLFTALNMACGFVAIVLAMQDRFYIACLVLILGAIFDSVDGRVARLMGTQSSFGEQFDSLSDAISFGFAPAMLVYLRLFTDMGRLGIAVSFLFLLCAALRLARFNANIEKITSNYFQGLPSPGAAMALVGLVLLLEAFPSLEIISYGWIIYVLFYAFLMISNIPFNSFKNSPWVKRHKKLVFLLLVVIIVMTFAYEQFMIIGGITSYVVGSLIYFFTHKGALQDVVQWKND